MLSQRPEQIRGLGRRKGRREWAPLGPRAAVCMPRKGPVAMKQVAPSELSGVKGYEVSWE